MYIHYCRQCQRLHLLNGHKMFCPKCDTKLNELRISYLDFVNMDREQRELLRLDCQNDALLPGLSTHYRMYKYSKWYKQMQKSSAETLDKPVMSAEESISS